MENLCSVRPASSGSCLFCRAKTSLVCHRCGDFYCSKKCQLKDWQRHRYICFPIPALVQPAECSAFGNVEVSADEQIYHELTGKEQVSTVVQPTKIEDEANDQAAKTSKTSSPCSLTNTGGNVNETATAVQPSCDSTLYGNNNKNNNRAPSYSVSKKTSLKITTPPFVALPLDGSNVYVMSFRAPNRCFVRDASETAEKEYFDICYKINMLGKEQPKLQKLKSFGFALAKLNGLFQRVKVLAVYNNHNARLDYIDTGIVKYRNGVEMREISSELLELPCHSSEVRLKDIPNYAFNIELINFVTKFEGEQYSATIDCRKHIELHHQKQEKSVNAQIRDFCSNIQVFGAPSPATDIKSTRPKARANQLNNRNIHKNVESNQEVHIDLTAQKIPTTSKSKFEFNQTERYQKTNRATFLKAIDDRKKNADPEQLTKANCSIKLDFDSNCEEKFEENSSSIYVGMEPIPDVKMQTEVNDLPKESATSFILKPQPIPLNTYSGSNIDPVLNAPFEMRRFSSIDNKGLDVCIVHNVSLSRGIFGAFDSKYAREFTDLQSRLSKFKDSEPYRPILKEYVIVKFENDWYRARVIDIKTNQSESIYNVMQLEFTNTATVTYNDIRRYPVDLTLPCYSSICLIEGFPNLPTKEQIDFLEEELQVHSLLHIDSVSYLQDMALVKCKALLDVLNKMS